MDIIEVSSDYKDFKYLASLLDQDIKSNYKLKQIAYNEINISDTLDKIIVGYLDGEPIACGGFSFYDSKSIEIKRMFVVDSYRNKGFSSQILRSLEQSCSDLGYHSLILGTGNKQLEAIKFYKKFGYYVIENYGQYAELKNSICMKKVF